jgi:hypothetical protein
LVWETGLDGKKRDAAYKEEHLGGFEVVYGRFRPPFLYDPASLHLCPRGLLSTGVWDEKNSRKPFVDNVLYGYNYGLFQAPLLELTSLQTCSTSVEIEPDELAHLTKRRPRIIRQLLARHRVLKLMMLLHKINSQGKGLVETATLPFSPVHIILERSLLVVNEASCAITRLM